MQNHATTQKFGEYVRFHYISNYGGNQFFCTLTRVSLLSQGVEGYHNNFLCPFSVYKSLFLLRLIQYSYIISTWLQITVFWFVIRVVL